MSELVRVGKTVQKHTVKATRTQVSQFLFSTAKLRL